MGNSLLINKDKNHFQIYKKTLLSGLLLRLAMLIFILTIGTELSEPYFLTDDIKYETLAKHFLNEANGPFDFDLFDSLTIGYMQQFWPLVECIAAKLFRNIYAGRFINVLLSTAIIAIIYEITYELSGKTEISHKAAKLFAYLPMPVMICCFPIKDIYLSFSVMYAFYVFILIQSGKKVSIQKIILCTLLLIGVYFTRGAVTEMLIMFLLVYYMQKLLKQKKYSSVVLLVVATIIFLLFFSDVITSAFQTKVDDYSGYADRGEGINFIKVTGISNIYKLPLAYAFATLQPLKLDLLSVGDSFWLTVMSYANITMYPIAVGNVCYIITKKHNLFFWLSTFIMYSAVIILSLGIFRHYLFLLPVQIINYSLFIERDPESNNVFSLVGSVILFIIIFLASVLNIF